MKKRFEIEWDNKNELVDAMVELAILKYLAVGSTKGLFKVTELSEQEEPLLGLATTKMLLDELFARIELDGKLDYRTVDEK